jgi:hypothetical protein
MNSEPSKGPFAHNASAPLAKTCNTHVCEAVHYWQKYISQSTKVIVNQSSERYRLLKVCCY